MYEGHVTVATLVGPRPLVFLHVIVHCILIFLYTAANRANIMAICIFLVFIHHAYFYIVRATGSIFM